MKKTTQTAPLILIAINVAVFVVVALCHIINADLFGKLTVMLSLSSAMSEFLFKPWTLLTYSLFNGNVLQLVFNMLWLYCFGRMLLIGCRERVLYGLYLTGALAGGLTFVAFGSFFGHGAVSFLMGSSAAIIAIAVAVAILMPDRELNMPLFGEVKIKWIVTVVVLIFFIGLSAPNAGGNLAHIGGAIAGAVYAYVLKYLHNNKLNHQNMATEYQQLLEKIRTSGYDTMNKKEKQRFFELSKYGRKNTQKA